MSLKSGEAHHLLESFDCGDEALNRFLIRFALANQRARAGLTYMVLAADAVAGFHTLVVGEVNMEQAPERMLLLAQLASAQPS